MNHTADYLMLMQGRVRRWVIRTLGEHVLNDKRERGMRLFEEATEVAQALGITPVDLVRVVDRVYSRPVGELHQEFGGTAVTLLAAAASCGVVLSDALETEVKRIEEKDPNYFRNKHRQKQEAGVAKTYELPKGHDVHVG